MNKLTAKQLLMINQKLTGDSTKPNKEVIDLIEEIIQMPYEQDDAFLYKYRGIFAKASKLGCSISQIKPFEHKNNQTAVIAVLTLLELNGVKLVDHENSIAELVLLFKAGDLDGGCKWLKEHQADSSIG